MCLPPPLWSDKTQGAPSCRRPIQRGNLEALRPSCCFRFPDLVGWCFCVFSGLLTQRCPGCGGSSPVTFRLFVFSGPLGESSALALHETHVCASVSECEREAGGHTEARRRLLHGETSVFGRTSRVSDVLLQGSHFFNKMKMRHGNQGNHIFNVYGR